MRRAPGLAVTVVVVAAALVGCGSHSSSAVTSTQEHAVLVHLANTDADAVFALEDELEPAIADAGVGEYDGNDIAVDGSEAILYAYGPDADALWDVMSPIVQRANPPAGSYVVKRYGDVNDPDAREVRIELGTTNS